MNDPCLLLVLFDPAATIEEEFNEWYDTEHLPERAVIPGFLTAQRYVCLGGGPRYAALYDLQDRAVLDGDAYRAVAGENFSPWSKRIMKRCPPQRLIARLDAGNGLTGRAPRLALLKFSLGAVPQPGQLASELDRAFSNLPLRRLRVYADVEPEADCALAVAEFGAVSVARIEDADFGALQDRLAMLACYRPYAA
jgi:hypothetical protein